MTAFTSGWEQWQAFFDARPHLAKAFPFFAAQATQPPPCNGIAATVESFTVATTSDPTGRSPLCDVWVVNLHLKTMSPPSWLRPLSGAARILEDGVQAELPELQVALADVYESVARDLGERLMSAYEKAKQ